MPADTFFKCLAYLLMIVFMHFFGILSTRRLYNPENRVNIKIKDLFAKYWQFMTMTAPYFLFFLIQSLVALIFPQH